MYIYIIYNIIYMIYYHYIHCSEDRKTMYLRDVNKESKITDLISKVGIPRDDENK